MLEGWQTKRRVVIAEDHVSLRQMLALLFNREPNLEVVGEADTGLQAIDICRAERPDLLVLDLVLPELCGIEVIRRVRRELPQTRVLIYSGAADERMIARALNERPHGFVQKSDTLATLWEALRVVGAGGSYLTPLATNLLNMRISETIGELTRREREVLQMVVEGATNKEIAKRLGLSVRTVDNHRAYGMRKLSVRDVGALTLHAVRNCWLTIG